MQSTPANLKEPTDSCLSHIANPCLSMKPKIGLCLAALLLFGCVSEPITVGWVSSQTQTTYDQFQKLSWTTGPYIRFDDTKGYVGHLYLCIATNDSGWSEFLLGIENTSKDQELFASAASMTGEVLSSQQLESHYDGVLFREKVRVVLSKDLLISCKSSGLTVRLYGQQRDLDVTVPAVYIQGFLRKA